MYLPDFESLRCFEAAAIHLNFRTAAARVGLSPAAFSDRIKVLEDGLDTKLFERTTRRVALSEAGRRLLPQARRCLEEARRCVDVTREDGRRAPFAITLGTRHELGMSWLLPALDRLGERRPERTVNLYFGNGADLLSGVERGTLDAMVSSLRLTRSGLAYANLHEERYVLVTAPALRDSQRLEGPNDVRNVTLLDSAPDLPLFRYYLDALTQPEVWTFQRHEILGTIAAVRERILAGRGIGVLPRYFVAEDLEQGRLVQLVPDVEPRIDTFRLVWRAGDPREGEFQALADELRTTPLR